MRISDWSSDVCSSDLWWKAFGDPQLDRLVNDALANNPSLSEALARVRGAQAQAQAAGAATRPGVTLDGDEVRKRFSANYYIPQPDGGCEYWVGQVVPNLSWDLEFWGLKGAIGM